MKTIIVRFYTGNSGLYHYAIEDETKVNLDDTVVLHNGTELRLATVVDVIAGVSSKATKTIVSVINEETMKAYEEANVRIKEQKELYRRLDELLAQESEVNKYRRLAETNSEAANILAKLKI